MNDWTILKLNNDKMEKRKLVKKRKCQKEKMDWKEKTKYF